MELTKKQKRALNKLRKFGPITNVCQTPKRVLYYSEGVEYLAHTCTVWNTIMYVKPIIEMLATDNDGFLYVILSKNETGGTRVNYQNSRNEDIGEDFYHRETFLLNQYVLMYRGGALLLPHEWNPDWFEKMKLNPIIPRP
ncbi:hypothetical protein MTsPCn9_34420 [Croceitalea sp. MTPC9]|uniref:hypothetical protein n=1 Tax=unclassified Croceitalea TaxID=2632280 RepID=UPI002B3BF974|nr:hypothetical protein MTsPCn6_34530 [Croceitalea sp. MTPC6]GMN18502.1 hypothetical protein MTsPCn9_34420 [Croceitalea sp. MTPC9]